MVFSNVGDFAAGLDVDTGDLVAIGFLSCFATGTVVSGATCLFSDSELESTRLCSVDSGAANFALDSGLPTGDLETGVTGSSAGPDVKAAPAAGAALTNEPG